MSIFKAFYGCTSLTSITIPNSVTSIGDYAFKGCSGLTSITIPESVTSIGSSAFYNCTGLTSVTIPNNVTSVATNAFANCTNITSIHLDCQTVGNWFADINAQIKTIELGDSVKTIGQNAFKGFTGLTSITIPSNVTSIGNNAFSGCSSLTSVNISDIEKWSQISFGNKSANPLYYAKHLYLNGEEVTKLIVDNDVSNYAFINCGTLTAVDVKGVGTSAFEGCPNITSVKVDCETVDNWFADSKTKVHTLTLGESVTTINKNSFDGFSALKKVYIGSNVTTVGSKTFANCSKLEDVYCLAVRYPAVEKDAFDGSYVDYVTLHVPAQSVNQYKAHEVWGKFMSVVPITDEETSIEGISVENTKKTVIYNMNGQRIHKTKKGLYIIDGKKVLVR